MSCFNCSSLTVFVGRQTCESTNGCKYWADDEGFTKHPEEDCYIKISDEFENIPPILSESSKSGKVVANDLLQNYYETLGENRYLHLFILGHMVMGLYYKAFTKLKLGAPIPIVCGASCAGKSVTTNNGISLFGLSDELMMAGESSLYGVEGIANTFIGVTINNPQKKLFQESCTMLLTCGQALKCLKKLRITKFLIWKKQYITMSIC